MIREVEGKTASGVINRGVWDLRHVPPPASSAGRGGGGGGEEGGGGEAGGGEAGGGGRGGGRGNRPVDLPIPMHDIGLRGPYVSPGTYKVTLDVDGDTTSRTFEVRADPGVQVTLAQHKAREAFLLDVQAQQVKVERMAADLRARWRRIFARAAPRLRARTRRGSWGSSVG
jgi:hypothetical protein